ncbi:MAG: VWA domain-containing protein, partial [bacterium]
MTFLAPAAFWLLVLLPGLLFGYVLLPGRKRKAVHDASLQLVMAALSPATGRRRHVPAGLLLLCLAAGVFAIARPVTALDTPDNERTIILALDVSTSMSATDVGRSRFEAAKAAAAAFISSQPAGVRIGIVSFAEHADLVHPPTRDPAEAIASLDRLYLQHDTSIGVGLLASLLALFPDENLAGHLDLFGMGRSPVGAGTAPRPRRPPCCWYSPACCRHRGRTVRWNGYALANARPTRPRARLSTSCRAGTCR